MKKYIPILGLLGAFLLGGAAGFFFRAKSDLPRPTAEPRYVAADNAIARFGVAPVNPDWVQVTHKSGQPIDGVPSPEWTVFTFLHEPKVEKVEQPNGSTVWKVTFSP